MGMKEFPIGSLALSASRLIEATCPERRKPFGGRSIALANPLLTPGTPGVVSPEGEYRG
jgi:hypothetical protein